MSENIREQLRMSGMSQNFSDVSECIKKSSGLLLVTLRTSNSYLRSCSCTLLTGLDVVDVAWFRLADVQEQLNKVEFNLTKFKSRIRSHII